MKSAALVIFAIVSGSIASPAQTASIGVAGMEALDQPTVFRPAPATGGCPVSLRAQHGATGTMVQTDKSRPNGLAQLLHLTLNNPDPNQIVSARVRVHGLSGRARVSQALSGPGGADTTANFAMRFFSAQGNSVTGDLWVPGMTAVLRIDLTSVTFADASTRSFAMRDACRVAPDPFMLIADR